MDRKKEMKKNMYPLSIFKKESKQEQTQFLPSFFFFPRAAWHAHFGSPHVVRAILYVFSHFSGGK